MSIVGRKPQVGTAATSGKEIVLSGQPGALVAPAEELSEAALPIWDVLVTDLARTGVFRESDKYLLLELCESLASAQAFRRNAADLQARLDRAEAELNDEMAEVLSSRLKRSRTGYLQSMKLVMSIAAEFGISPVARVRLGLMAVQGQTLADALQLGSDD